MKTFINPKRDTWPEILKRPLFDVSDLYGNVQTILNEIKLSGDSALQKYTLQFDGIKLNSFLVIEKEIKEAENQVEDDLKEAISLASKNMKNFIPLKNKNLIKLKRHRELPAGKKLCQ